MERHKKATRNILPFKLLRESGGKCNQLSCPIWILNLLSQHSVIFYLNHLFWIERLRLKTKNTWWDKKIILCYNNKKSGFHLTTKDFFRIYYIPQTKIASFLTISYSQNQYKFVNCLLAFAHSLYSPYIIISLYLNLFV